jgi:hypothetical protein
VASTSLKKIAFAAAVLAGCAFLLYLVDDGWGLGWPHNTVRNWEDFGFWNLHGKLVFNPAGFEVTTHPQAYSGMSPLSLWIVFFFTKLFGWTGFGTMSFHLVLAAAIFWGTRHALGRDRYASAVAVAILLSPGYVRWQKHLDPNTITVLIGIPFAAIIISILQRTTFNARAIAVLVVLTLAFICTNWTCTWVLGPLTVLLLTLPGINRRAAMIWIACALVASVAFAALSMMIKAGAKSDIPNHSGLTQFILSYTWGHVGYGQNLTTRVAFARLAFVSGIALLCFFATTAWVVARSWRATKTTCWLVVLPAAVALAEIAFMRNYFGHHPWMASPLIIVGIVFSLCQLRAQTPAVADTQPSTALAKPLRTLAAAALVFAYGVAVLLFFRANSRNSLMLTGLIRTHTARSDFIWVTERSASVLAQFPDRFTETLDRRVVALDSLEMIPTNDNRGVIVSSAPLEGLRLIAQTDMPGKSSPLQGAVQWFNQSVARRSPSDRLEPADHYYLYAPASASSAAR